MSSETVQTAPEQPAQVAQTSSEVKKGAGNTSISDFARKIAGAQVPPPAFTPKTEAVVVPKVEAKAATETEAAPEQKEKGKEAPAEATTEEPKTEAETPAEPAEATKEEADEVLSPEKHNLDPKLKEKIERRIGKEVAKRKALEREVESLKAAVAAQQAPVAAEKEVIVQAPANVPLAEITTIPQLEQLKQEARAEIRWAEQYLEDDIPAEGIQTDRGLATKKQLLEVRRNARIVQEDLIPQREKFLTSRQTATQTAYEKFPFLKDPTHPGYQMAQAAKRDPANAWLHGLPNAEYVLGVQITGLLALQAEERAKVNGDAKVAAVKPKPVPTRGQSEIASDASITRAPTGMQGKNALDAEIAKITGGKKSLGAKDFAAMLLAKQRFRNSQ